MPNVKIAYRMHGVTYRQFDYWCRQGWIRPASSDGSGHDRYFPMDELRVFRIIATLTNIGFKPYYAAELARAVVYESGCHGTLVLRGKRAFTTGILSDRGNADRGNSGTDTRAG